jgi:hypothetical protein
MSLFGKILAFFNVLAAIAFLALAGMDYNKRNSWSYSHFRHQVAIHGLPVTDNDDAWRLPGRSIASDLTPKALKDIFASAGAREVKTQVLAVKQIQEQINQEISGAADNLAKKLVIAKYLFPLAKTGDERELYQQFARDPNKPAETLQQQLNGLMDLAVSETDQTGATRDLEARRKAIADLLYNLGTDPTWHARVMAVVGLQHYIGAADRQAANLQQMAARLTAAISDEQSAFVSQYQSHVPHLQLLSEQVRDLDSRLKEQQELVQKHTILRNARQAEVADFQKNIQEATAKAAQEMETLQGLQKQLFALQQGVAVAQARNQQLERELRTKETGK